jgi:hypothetical protein
MPPSPQSASNAPVFQRGDGGLPSPGDLDAKQFRKDAAEIRAALVSHSAAWPLTFKGWVVVGDLDLKDFVAPDRAAPSLVLENCWFLNEIDMSHGRFGRVSFKGSRFSLLDARQAHFDGEFDFSEVATSELPGKRTGCKRDETGAETEKEQGRCEIQLQGATIQQRVYGGKAKLCAGTKPADFDTALGGLPYALKLGGATLSGDLLTLQPDFVAIGGVNMCGAQVAGDVWLQGATLIASSNEALTLERATVSGVTALSATARPPGPTGSPQKNEPDRVQQFRSYGLINLRSAEFHKEFYMGGAKLDGPELDTNLFAYQTKFDKQFTLATWEEGSSDVAQFTASGHVQLSCPEMVIA